MLPLSISSMYLSDWDENYPVDDEDWSSESRRDGSGAGSGSGSLNVPNTPKKNLVSTVHTAKSKHEATTESGGGGALWLVVVIFVVAAAVALVFFRR